METQGIHKRIYEIKGQRVMFDFDLAALYDVETRALNQAVKRNKDLFPADFMFRVSPSEWQVMSSQFVTTSSTRPKIAPPFAFTEHGVAMLANVLKSKKARKTSIAIVRAFIALKEYALSHKELTARLHELEDRFNKRFKDVSEAINYLLQKEKQEEKYRHRTQVGFKIQKKNS